MISITSHASAAEITLERRDVGGPIEPFTKLDFTLTSGRGEQQYISIYFNTLITADLEKVRDEIDRFLAEIAAMKLNSYSGPF